MLMLQKIFLAVIVALSGANHCDSTGFCAPGQEDTDEGGLLQFQAQVGLEQEQSGNDIDSSDEDGPWGAELLGISLHEWAKMENEILLDLDRNHSNRSLLEIQMNETSGPPPDLNPRAARRMNGYAFADPNCQASANPTTDHILIADAWAHLWQDTMRMITNGRYKIAQWRKSKLEFDDMRDVQTMEWCTDFALGAGYTPALLHQMAAAHGSLYPCGDSPLRISTPGRGKYAVYWRRTCGELRADHIAVRSAPRSPLFLGKLNARWPPGGIIPDSFGLGPVVVHRAEGCFKNYDDVTYHNPNFGRQEAPGSMCTPAGCSNCHSDYPCEQVMAGAWA